MQDHSKTARRQIARVSGRGPRWMLPALLPLLAMASAAHADPRFFHVGAGCPYATIQAALDAERASPGSPADYVYVARNQSYTAQDVQIHDQNVFIYGGVDDCTDSSTSGTTTLSGSGGSAKSVMTISGHSRVGLGALTITQGDNTSTGVGGGINFVGSGWMRLSSMTVTNNRAGYGGGININGTGSGADIADIEIGSETLITGNTANTSGGGIRVEGNSVLRITEPQVLIGFNEAVGGYGGGLEVIGPAHAYLGSPGYRFAEYVGLLFQNSAQNGGGLSINGGDDGQDSAHVCLFTTDPQHPVRIEGNAATYDGGGIYLGPVAGGALSSGSGASIEGGNYRIATNSAQEGSAVYVDSDYSTISYDIGGSANLRGTCAGVSLPDLGAVACASEECNRIDGNVAQDISGQPTDGSTLFPQARSDFDADPVRIIGNQGAHMLRAISGYTSGFIDYTTDFWLENCLIAGNVVESDLVVAGTQTGGGLRNCKIADNAIGAGSVPVNAAGIFFLTDDIFAQGQTPSLVYPGGNPDNLSIDYVLSMEVASLSQGSHVVQGDASFVDSASGNYHLLPTSLAIDRAPPVTGDDRDLDGLPRDQDMPTVPNQDGVRDLGAYERQLRYCGAADTIFCSGFEQ